MPTSGTRPPAALRWAMTALFAGMVMTDRFRIAIGSFPLGLTMPLAYVLLAVLLLEGRLALDALSLADRERVHGTLGLERQAVLGRLVADALADRTEVGVARQA